MATVAAMDITRYGIGVATRLGIDEAEAAVRAALSEQGFSILTEIDVAATLEAKLGVAREPYRILGACNPHLASRALAIDPQVGLLLPCNVIIHQTAEGTRVEVIEPSIMAELVADPAMAGVAEEARRRLVDALGALVEA